MDVGGAGKVARAKTASFSRNGPETAGALSRLPPRIFFVHNGLRASYNSAP
jgi:hypothetical protein